VDGAASCDRVHRGTSACEVKKRVVRRLQSRWQTFAETEKQDVKEEAGFALIVFSVKVDTGQRKSHTNSRLPSNHHTTASTFT